MTELDKEISTLRSGLKAVEMVSLSLFLVLIPSLVITGVQRRSCQLPWHAGMLGRNIYY